MNSGQKNLCSHPDCIRVCTLLQKNFSNCCVCVEMETARAIYIDSSEYKLSKVEILRGLVTEKLTSAVREILAVVETTVSVYEDEVSGLKREVALQKKQLDALLNPQVNLYRIVLEDAGDQDILSPVATEEGKGEKSIESTRREHKHMGRQSHQTSDIRTEKNEANIEPTTVDVSCEEMVSVKGAENDICTLEEPLSDSSEPCPANRESCHSDDEVDDAHNKESKNKRKRRLPRRYVMSHSETDSDDNDNKVIEDNRDNEWKPNEKGEDVKKNHSDVKKKKKYLRKIRIGLLKNCADTNSSNEDFRLARPVQTVMCQQNLSESDFLIQLRSNFPELRENKPFDVFVTDDGKRLLPLVVNRMTPKEICRSVRSTGKGQWAVYIRLKREDKDTGDTLIKTTTTSNDDNNKPSTSNLEKEQPMETEEGGISNPTHEQGNVCSADSASQSEGEDEDDHDKSDDWKPEQSAEVKEHSDCQSKSEKRTKGRQLKKKKRSIQSSLKKGTAISDSCKVCGYLFRSKAILTKHATSHVDDPKGLCGVCGEHLDTSEELRCHLESHQKLYQCDTCGRFFVTLVSFEMHTATHTKEKLFKCHICEKAFALETRLNLHKLVHTKDKPYKCDICPQSFLYKLQLDAHNMRHTGEKLFCCDICGKSVSDFRSLSRHKLIHTGEKNYNCKYCEKQFYSSSKAKQHEKIHTPRAKKYLCDICSKTFYSYGELRVHQQRHEEKHILICTVCNKPIKGTLRRHMMIHTGEKPFSCSECDGLFRTQTHLKIHMKTHLDIRPFTCNLCGKMCRRQEHLKVHMRTHTGDKPYQCALCDKAFTQSHCLKSHMKCHEGEQKSAADGFC